MELIRLVLSNIARTTSLSESQPYCVYEGINMRISRTSKIWLAGVGGGALTLFGGVMLVTGVGSGAGAVAITSGLAAIGGSMLGGIGVIAAGSATAALITSALAMKLIKDPELVALAEKLKTLNELYEHAKYCTTLQKNEVKDLNSRIGEILKSKKKDSEELEQLKERLSLLAYKIKNREAV